VPDLLPPPPDAAERLAVIDAFASLPPQQRDELANEITWLRLRGGEVLFRQDEPADAALFIIRGRLRVFSVDVDGTERPIGDRAAGDPIGEVGVLADVPRTATVRAVRDTDLARVDRETFDRLLRSTPSTMVPLVSTVARRMADALRGRPFASAGISTLAVMVDPGTTDATSVIDGLVEALERQGPTTRVRVDASPDSMTDAALIGYIDEQEAQGRVTVIDVEPTASEPARRALRQADCVVVITDAGSRPVEGVTHTLLERLMADGALPTRILVVLQPQWRARPVASASQAEGFDLHFHVRPGARDDLDRLARHLTARAIALVLGGGGARGMSHIGAYRALVEAGVPIDEVGGSSIGGVVAAQIALGWTPEELLARNLEEWAAAHITRRVTIPLLSLLSPHSGIRMMEKMFGDADFEDLWLRCFVTAADLTDCRLAILDRGRVARWCLATASPPGAWPPVVGDDGTLLVDGAVLDNLPVLPMRERGASRAIAVSVSQRVEMHAGAGVAQTPSPLEFARDLVRRDPGRSFPNLLQVLLRTSLVTGLARHDASRAASDVYVEPAVGAFGMGSYDKGAQIAPLGYDAMRRALDEHADLLASWT